MLLDVVTLDARSAATRWAVKGMVPDASLGMIFGASGTFKSFVALDYQLHRAWAMAWCGRRTVAGVPIFVAAEGGTGLIRRIKAWHLARGLDWRECRLLVVVVPLLLMRQAQALADAIAAHGVQPCDIVIDTLSQTFDGNENAADEVASYLRALRVHLVDRFACSVTVVHHSGHGATERPRGSSAIMANVDYLFGVFRQGDESMTTTVECLKVKDGEKFKPVDFVLEPFQVGIDEDGEAVTSLAARYVNNAEAVLKADDRKREGHRALLLRLAGALLDERETRKAFDAELADTPDGTRRAAWKRAIDWAVDNGMLRRINGRFEVVRSVAEVVE
jgi:RecA-family ATPase